MRQVHPMTRVAIAVVDDEPGVRRGLSRLLRAADLDARTYASGQEFLEAWELNRPDCLVIDLNMPDVNGLDVQSHLKRAGADLPVIVMSGNDEVEARRKCLALGAAAYLRKPLDGEELLQAIRTAVKSAH